MGPDSFVFLALPIVFLALPMSAEQQAKVAKEALLLELEQEDAKRHKEEQEANKKSAKKRKKKERERQQKKEQKERRLAEEREREEKFRKELEAKEAAERADREQQAAIKRKSKMEFQTLQEIVRGLQGGTCCQGPIVCCAISIRIPRSFVLPFPCSPSQDHGLLPLPGLFLSSFLALFVVVSPP
jgi:hypothetical protein